MRRINLPVKVIGFVVLAAAGIGLCVSLATRQSTLQAGQPGGASGVVAEEFWKEKGYHYQEAGECMSCHTGPNAQRVGKGAFEISLLTEYSIWKTHDKHAQAYAVLIGDRGKLMGKVLGKDVLKPETGCLSCHAMHNLSDLNAEVAKKAGNDKIKGLDAMDGVSCGGCHGPSSAWLGKHDKRDEWRDKLDAKAKHDLGLRDLHDPVVRAQLCASCHIGNANEGKVVTHAMMAAGHPPLPPIELSTFSKNEPQHWREFKNTPSLSKLKDAEFERTKFAVIGNVVAVRETLKLAHDRTKFSHPKPQYVFPELAISAAGGTAQQRWPEIAMAHSDCYACHHDLKYPGFRQKRGFGYSVPGVGDAPVTPGRPMIRAWPLAALKVGLDAAEKKPAGLADALKKLAAATSGRPFGDPADIGRETEALVKWCDELITELNTNTSFNRAQSLKILRGLCSLYDDEVNKTAIPDYETARQIGSMAAMVAEDLKIDQAKDIIKELTASLNLHPYTKRELRVGVLLDVTRDAAIASGSLKPNQVDDFKKAAAEFGDYLKNIADTEKLKGMFTNQFFVILQLGISNKAFTDELTKKAVADKLQGFSDEEQVQVLKVIADYKPADFQATMKKFAKVIPAN